MDSNWKKFISNYNNQKSYWQVHKRDLDEAEALLMLEIFKKFEGQSWTKNQGNIKKELIKEGLIKPYKDKGQSTSSALVRGLTRVMTRFGLMYWDEATNKIYITPVGYNYLRYADFGRLKQQQLWKFMIYNPNYRGTDFLGCNIVPHAILIKILIDIKENYITKKEFNLFVPRIEKSNEVEKTINSIYEWRKLNQNYQDQIIKRLADIRISARGGSMYTKIYGCSNYTINFLVNDLDYVNQKNEKIFLKKKGNAIKLFEEFSKNFELINFHSKQDWMEFYGDLDRKLTKEEALEYYEKKGFSGVKKYKDEALKIYKSSPNLRRSRNSKEFEENYENEIQMHNWYAKNPEAIERGLKVVPNGFKFNTNTFRVGEIDLLCKDKDGNYVVVEFKKRHNSDKAVGQTMRYVGWVTENLAKEKRTRAIIVSREHREEIEWAAKAIHDKKGRKILELVVTQWNPATKKIKIN